MDFLKNFDKELSKIEGVAGLSEPPRYWHSTGNFVLNHIISGDFYNGIPQGRITGLAGPSGVGKSFLSGNIAKQAQDDDAFCLVIDSENALDIDFLNKIGVDTDSEHLKYISVITIAHVTKVVSSFLKQYKGEYGSDEQAPKVVIIIDSLDMLLTETEHDNYGKGIQKGDQGQRNKQLKAMLRSFVQDVKNLNVSIVVTCQVYRNQDLLNGEGNWIVSDAVRYSLSQIILLTKLKLKDDKTVTGIRMKCEGYKTRFTKPFQTVTIEVPYETGMDKNSGLLEVLIQQGNVKQKGAWYEIVETGEKFQRKNFSEYSEELLKTLDGEDQFFKVDEKTEALDSQEEPMSAKSRRFEKIQPTVN